MAKPCLIDNIAIKYYRGFKIEQKGRRSNFRVSIKESRSTRAYNLLFYSKD